MDDNIQKTADRCAEQENKDVSDGFGHTCKAFEGRKNWHMKFGWKKKEGRRTPFQ
jgi:hypothetical protein